jgi:hypothetical protein
LPFQMLASAAGPRVKLVRVRRKVLPSMVFWPVGQNAREAGKGVDAGPV